MAARFAAGGRLLVFGSGVAATDAEHIAVEFVHPVIVGKRALPALSLASDGATVMSLAGRGGLDGVFAHQLDVFGRPDDVALGLSADGNCASVLAGLRRARQAGLATVALVGGDGGAIARDRVADDCIVVVSDDRLVVKEAHVTIYHVLWELVHVFFDHPEVLQQDATRDADPGVESLYPFLYGGGRDSTAVLDDVERSTVEKVAEVVALRHQVGVEIAPALAACADEVAARFISGGTLFAFGNGGSSTDAQEIVCTLLDVDQQRRSLPALGLTNDVAIVTALSNDVGFDVVFARQLRAFGRAGDVALGVSTSGGSANVLAAFDEAKSMGMTTVGLAGYGGGRMAESRSVDHLFAVPSSSVHRVQEVQTTIYHVLCEAVQEVIAAGQPAAG